MNRIVRIFRKDAAHLWPQIAVFVATLVLFACNDPIYETEANRGLGPLLSFARLLYALLPLACWLLVTSVIREETPIGHEQYWLTRPFSLADLAAAKALFLLAFINLPVFLCQAAVLAAMGFPPLGHLGELFARQVFLTALLLLPMAAMAAVTRSLGHAFLGGLLLALVMAVAAQMVAGLASGSAWGGLAWIPATAVAAVAMAGSAAVLYLQYTGRRTALPRMVLAGAAVLVVLLWAAPPWQPAFAFQSLFSQRRIDARAVRISFDRRPGAPPDAVAHVSGYVAIPIQIADIPPGLEVTLDWIRIEAEGGGLKPWRSGWRVNQGITEASGKGWLMVAVDAGYFERVKNAPVRLHGSADLTLVARTGDLAAFGQCWFIGSTMVACLSPLPRAALTLVSSRGAFGYALPGIQAFAPYPTSPWFGPLQRWNTVVVGGNTLAVDRPVAHLERAFDLGPLRLADYQIAPD